MVELSKKLINVRKALEQEEIVESGFEHRDNMNLEVKFDYFIQPRTNVSTYDVVGYVFMPNELKINKETYSKIKFYRDFQGFIRFQTPIFPLEGLVSENNQLSPLNRIQWLLDSITNGMLDGISGSGSGGNVSDKLIYEMKMLAQMVRSNLRNQVIFLIDLFPRDDAIEIVNENIPNLVQTLRKVQARLFEHGRNLYNFRVPEQVRECYRAADEYVSYYIEHYLTILADQVLDEEIFKGNLPILEKMIVEQQLTRKKKGYVLVLDLNPAGDQDGEKSTDLSKFHHWKVLLKNYIKQVLNLNIREREERQKYLQIIGAIGAIIAMAVSFFLGYLLQQYLPDTSFPFILSVLVAYALKDRIKFSINTSGEKWLAKWTPDKKYDIEDPLKNQKIGVSKESMQFVTHSKVSSDVMLIRNKDRKHLIERELGSEDVILFKKHIKLFNSKIIGLHDRHKNINDILHINIRNFLTYALEPESLVPLYDGARSEVRDVAVPVMYHVNLVLKLMYRVKEGGNEKKVQFKHIRIIFNKNGIQKVEQIDV
ncbi:MAG: hypothetical protein ACTSUE_24615 [Promethearchaeota archaeon]